MFQCFIPSRRVCCHRGYNQVEAQGQPTRLNSDVSALPVALSASLFRFVFFFFLWKVDEILTRTTIIERKDAVWCLKKQRSLYDHGLCFLTHILTREQVNETCITGKTSFLLEVDYRQNK